jgi:hypothetical protein
MQLIKGKWAAGTGIFSGIHKRVSCTLSMLSKNRRIPYKTDS